MKIKRYCLIVIFYLSTFNPIHAIANHQHDYTSSFRNMALRSCDTTFHRLENECTDMICRDLLVNAWAECWKRSMNNELNKRLLTLKSTDKTEFHIEMAIQKSFNQATHDLCGKKCGSDGTMKGIPYNFCRVDAYQYRTAQAIQINKNQLSIPMKNAISLKKSRKEKVKETYFFKLFINQLCHMPNDIWNNGSPPVNCQSKSFKELNAFEFTDDVCDLS